LCENCWLAVVASIDPLAAVFTTVMFLNLLVLVEVLLIPVLELFNVDCTLALFCKLPLFVMFIKDFIFGSAKPVVFAFIAVLGVFNFMGIVVTLVFDALFVVLSKDPVVAVLTFESD
jgi:hypothetical protein